MRVADVSLAECDDEEAFIAASSDRPFCTFDQVLAESYCWNCRGFGHVRTTCPSSNCTRSIGYVIQALSSINEQKSKGGGKGKGKGKAAQGRGGEGRGRAAAGRGKGAIAVYLEDDQLWSLDGAYVASTVATLEDHTEHDEEAHTALTTRAADATSNSDSYDDGDGWLDEFDDTESVSADTANVATVTSSIEADENNSDSESSIGTDGNNSDSSTDYAQVVNYNDCESESEIDEDETEIEDAVLRSALSVRRLRANACGRQQRRSRHDAHG